MRNLHWNVAIKQFPRTALFSFGVALGSLMVSSVGSIILTDGGYAFGPSDARFVFACAFAITFIFLFVRTLLRG